MMVMLVIVNPANKERYGKLTLDFKHTKIILTVILYSTGFSDSGYLDEDQLTIRLTALRTKMY